MLLAMLCLLQNKVSTSENACGYALQKHNGQQPLLFHSYKLLFLAKPNG